jgi:hypothetical protein
MQAGTGVTMTGTSPKTISVNSATVPTFLTARLVITGVAVPAFSCIERTMSLPGAGLDDAIAPGWPNLPAGLTGTMRVAGVGIVSVRLCNVTGGNLDVPATYYRATAVRSF